MKSKEITINGITYKIHSSTEAGLKKAISQLKKDIAKMHDQDLEK